MDEGVLYRSFRPVLRKLKYSLRGRAERTRGTSCAGPTPRPPTSEETVLAEYNPIIIRHAQFSFEAALNSSHDIIEG